MAESQGKKFILGRIKDVEKVRMCIHLNLYVAMYVRMYVFYSYAFECLYVHTLQGHPERPAFVISCLLLS